MKKVVQISVLFFLYIVSFLWGVAAVRYEIFPYEQLRSMAQIGGVLPSDEDISPKVAARVSMFKMFSRPANVVMIGDSITANAEWEDIFQNSEIANRGIGGDTTYKILKRIDGIISVNPRKAFMMVGVNDFYKGLSVESVFNRYIEIVERLKDNGTRVFIQSTLDCSKKGCPRDKIKHLNNLLEKYAKEKDTTFININEKLSAEKIGLNRQFTYDGVHLNADGYFVLSNMLRKYM